MSPAFFDKRSVSDNLLYRDIGRVPERPFVIKAMLKETSFGDLACLLTCLATIKNQFDYAELHVRYRNIRPYSEEMMWLVPSIDTAVGLKHYLPNWARFGLADGRLWKPMSKAIDGNKWSWGSFCDLLVTDWMVNPRWLHAMPNPVPLRIPDDRAGTLGGELEKLGLDPDRWFATVHYRASSYLGKSSGELRNSYPAEIEKMITHIIDNLGGQVVMLGHPELEPFAPRANFVDLSRFKDNFLQQAFAISRCRFMIAGPSGPAGVGWCFQVPTATVDASDAFGGWARDENVTLSHEVTTPDGKVLRNQELYEAGLMDYPVLRDKIRAGERFTVRKNNAEELAAVADYLLDQTQDMQSWRAPAELPETAKPNQFVWPPQTHENVKFLDV